MKNYNALYRRFCKMHDDTYGSFFLSLWGDMSEDNCKRLIENEGLVFNNNKPYECIKGYERVSLMLSLRGY